MDQNKKQDKENKNPNLEENKEKEENEKNKTNSSDPYTDPNQLTDQGVPAFVVQSDISPEHGIEPKVDLKDPKNERFKIDKNKENTVEEYLDKIKDIDVQKVFNDKQSQNVKMSNKAGFNFSQEISEENAFQQNKKASIEDQKIEEENHGIQINYNNQTINPDNLGVESQNINEVPNNYNSNITPRNLYQNLFKDNYNVNNAINNKDNNENNFENTLNNLNNFLQQKQNENQISNDNKLKSIYSSNNIDNNLNTNDNINLNLLSQQSAQTNELTQNIQPRQNYQNLNQAQPQSTQNLSNMHVSDENISKSFAKNIHIIHDFSEVKHPNPLIPLNPQNPAVNAETELNPIQFPNRKFNQSFFSSLNKSNSMQEKDMNEFLNESLEEKAFKEWSLRMQKQEEEFKNAVRQIREKQSNQDLNKNKSKEAEQIDLHISQSPQHSESLLKTKKKSTTTESRSSVHSLNLSQDANTSNKNNETSFHNVELTGANAYDTSMQNNFQVPFVSAEKTKEESNKNDLLSADQESEKARKHEEEEIDKNLSEEQIQRVNERIFKWYCSYHFFILIFTIPIIVLSFILASNLKSSESNYFKALNYNWNSKLISGITEKGCESSQKYLLQEYWPGTQKGCNCYSYVKVGSCPRKSICTNVSERAAIPVSFWRGARFCRDSRWESLTYLDLVGVTGKGVLCPMNTRSCGTLDSQGNSLCVQNGLECPILSIAFFNLEDYDKIKDSVKQGDKVILFGKSALVYSNNEANFANKTEISIPVDFKVSPGQPCMNPNYENVNFPVYVLDKFAGKTKCLKYTELDDNSALSDKDINNTSLSYLDSTTNKINNANANSNNKNLFYDENWKLIDKTNIETLYIENRITEGLKSLPLFPYETIQHDTYLFSRSYIGLKNSCFKDIQRNEIQDYLLKDLEKISNFENLDSIVIALQVMSLFATAISFILFINGFLIISTGKRSRKQFRTDRSSAWIYFAIAIMGFSALIGIIITQSILLSKVSLSGYFGEVFGSSQCVDDFTVDLYNILLPKAQFVQNGAIVSLVFAIVDFILYAVYLFVAFYFTRKSVYL